MYVAVRKSYPRDFSPFCTAAILPRQKEPLLRVLWIAHKKTFRFWMWAIFSQDGPRSPASTSQIRFFSIWGLQYFIQASLMFAILHSSFSKGTYSWGPILVYFCCFPETSELMRCTIISSETVLSSPAFLPYFFAFCTAAYLRHSAI